MESKQKKVCVIMRGLSGSGKSTKINSLLKKYGGDNDNIFSTDNYWIPQTLERRRKGENVSPGEELKEYQKNFNVSKLGVAHEWNLRNFQAAVDLGMSPVIVDNTNSKSRDFLAYAKYANKYGYSIEIEEPDSPWWVEYRPYLKDKTLNPSKLDDFASLLSSKNKHGVPQSVIRNMMDKWQDDFNIDELLKKV